MAEVLFRARLTRADPNTPWGFRLQGGANFDRPLTLLKVLEGSVAAKSGLHAGDIVVKLAGQMAYEMTHKDAQEVIIESGDALEIIVERAEEVAMSPSKKPSSPPTQESKADDDMPDDKTTTTDEAAVPEAAVPAQPDETQTTISQNESSLPNEVHSDYKNSPTDPFPNHDLSQSHTQEAVRSGGRSGESGVSPASQKESQELNKLPEEVNQNEEPTGVTATHSEDSKTMPLQITSEAPLLQTSTEGSVDTSCISDNGLDKKVSSTDGVLPAPQADVLASSPEGTSAAPAPLQTQLSVIPMPVQPPLPEATVQSIQMSVTPQIIHPGYPPPVTTQAAAASLSSAPVTVHSVVTPIMVQASGSVIPGQSQPASALASIQAAAVAMPVKVSLAPTLVQPTISNTPADQHIPINQRLPSGHGEDSLGNIQLYTTKSISKLNSEKLLCSANEEPHVRLKNTEGDTCSKQITDVAQRQRKMSEGSRTQLLVTHSNSAGNIPSISDSNETVRLNNVVKSLRETGRSRSLDSDNRTDDQNEKKNEVADLYPWRRHKVQDGHESSRSSSSRSGPTPNEATAPIDVMHTEPIKPSLKLVGKRIESTTSGPPPPYPIFVQHERSVEQGPAVSMTMITVPVAPVSGSSPGHTLVKSDNTQRSVPQTVVAPVSAASPDNRFTSVPVGSSSSPENRFASGPMISSTSPDNRNSAYYPPGPEDIYFSAADPDLVDIPMPAVKEMVADLNRRLESIAAQHPHLAELGQNYAPPRKEQLESGASSEKEIFINNPPATDIDVLKQRIFGVHGSEQPDYQKIYDIKSPLSSPTAQRKIFISADFGKGQRKVHFAEPIEASVHEIPRHERREKRRELNRQLERELHSLGDVRERTEAVKAEIDMAKQHLINISQGSVFGPSGGHGKPTSVAIHSGTSHKLHPTHRHSVAGDPSSGGISVSISHRKGPGGPAPTQTFTLPAAQPGHPQHFRYTIAGRKSSQPYAIQYSFPPSYEESLRLRRGRQRSLDESMASVVQAAAAEHYLRTASGPISPTMIQRNPYMDTWPRRDITSPSPYHPGSLQPQQYMSVPSPKGSLSPSPDSMQSRTMRALETQAYARTSPLMSPTPPFPTSPQNSLSPTHPDQSLDTTQSKSFKALEAHLLEGGRQRTPESAPLSVQVLGQPSQVLQPAAVGRPFTPSFGGLREETSPELYLTQTRRFSGSLTPMGAGMGPHFANQSEAVSYGHPPPVMPGGVPGVFALFDKAFAEKVLQWQGQQQGRRSHFQSETYKLVHEMDDFQRKHGGAGSGSQ